MLRNTVGIFGNCIFDEVKNMKICIEVSLRYRKSNKKMNCSIGISQNCCDNLSSSPFN